jgi:probable phosphoglycerate mutase
MIYLMRHGETVWNVEQRLQGQGDSALTPKGLLQAAAYGRRLAAETLDVATLRVLCSPLRRAHHTAEIVVAALGLPHDRIEVEPRLSEFAFGLWEGLTWEEIHRDHLESFERRKADRWNVRVPGGECYADIAVRARAWLDEVGEDGSLVVISHGATSRVIRGLYSGLSPEATMALPEPQDRVFRLSRGRIEELLCFEGA